MRRVLALLVSAMLAWPILAATIPQANKFVKPVQFDVGTLCSNQTATSTQILLKPCTAGTDTVADCTTGELLSLTESTGDRLKARCFSPGTSTFSYSAFKAYLNDSVSYADGTITTENYRGVDIRGTALAINTATTGGSGACTGASNLISNPDLEGTVYCAREPATGTIGTCAITCGVQTTENPDHWVTGSSSTLRLIRANVNCKGGSGNCIYSPAASASGFIRTAAQQAAYENCGNGTCGGDSCTTGGCSGGGASGTGSGTLGYIALHKDATYTLTWYTKNASASGTEHVRLAVRAWNTTAQSTGACGGDYTLSGDNSGTGNIKTGTFSSWSAGGGGVVRYIDENNDGTFQQYTATISTPSASLTGVGDPFYATFDILPMNGGNPANVDQFWDDFAFCSPGVSVNASATTVRALTEDQLNFQPTVTRSGDSLTLGPFIGADITPTIAPSVVSGGTVTQSSAIGVQAGLPYTAPSGTYTLTTGTSLKVKKPGVGTTKYGAEVQGDLLMSDPDGTASKIIFQEPSNGADTLSLEAPALSGSVRYQLPPIPTLANSLMSCTAATPSVCTWGSISSFGIVTGSGTTSRIPKWTSSTALGDSILTESGSAIIPDTNATRDLGSVDVTSTGSKPFNVAYSKTLNGSCTAAPIGNSLVLSTYDATCTAIAGTATLGGGASSANLTLSAGAFNAASGTTSSLPAITMGLGDFTSTVASGGIAFHFVTSTTYSSGNLFRFQNNATTRATLTYNGELDIVHAPASSPSSAGTKLTQNLPAQPWGATNLTGYEWDPVYAGSASGSSNALYGQLYNLTGITSGNYAQLVGAYSSINLSPSAALGTVAEIDSFKADFSFSDGTYTSAALFRGQWDDFAANSAGTMTNLYGIRIADSGSGWQGIVVPTNQYGLYVESTGSTTANYHGFAIDANSNLTNGKKLGWSAALSTGHASWDTWLIGDTDGTSRTIKSEGAMVVDSCSNTAANTTITVNSCNMVTLTTNTAAVQTINHCNSVNNGRVLYILCDNVSASSVQEGGNVKLDDTAGTFTCNTTNGKDTLTLLCDGTNWLELARRTN